MSYHRSYFSKNNTIIKDSLVNTAKNPNTEILYGSGFSKFLFQLDLTGLQRKIDNGDLVLNANTKHYLHLTNTIFGDESLMGEKRGTGRQRATSFELVIFPIPEVWDEGVGYEYDEVYDYTTGNLTFYIRQSNWNNRTTNDPWTYEGVYTGSPITTIHFDNGNENLHTDVTEYINTLITGTTFTGTTFTGATNYGLGVSFDPLIYINIPNAMDQSVAFFTKYTQTFWEPYLETVFDDVIDDNRENFYIDVPRNLYLYVNYMGNPINLDSEPTVDILNPSSVEIPTLTGLTTTLIRKGVYKVTFGLSGFLCDGKRFYYDKWCNLSINGIPLIKLVGGVSTNCVTQKFIPKPYEALYDIGTNNTDVERYAIQFFGIRLNEKIKRGTIRKVVVTFKSINDPKPMLLDEVYYRIYVEEGKTQVNVFDWTKCDRTNENSFMLDTSFMIPREYNVEIKARVFGEDMFYREEINFEIISEK